MKTHETFYRVHGTRYIRDMITPVVWDSTIVIFPQKTVILWPNGGSTREYPTSDYGYFKNLHEPRIVTVKEYVTDSLIGSPKSRHKSTSEYIREGSKLEPKFKYVRNVTKLTIPSQSELILSMGVLNNNYKYPAHPLSSYYTWHNMMATTAVMSTMTKSGNNRDKYILLKLPGVIPNRNIISKYLGEPNRRLIKDLPDYTYFNILELFRFIDKKYKSYSVLSKYVPENEFKNVNIILTINNKSVIINLKVLASITDAYKIESNLSKYPSKTVNKILFIFLNKILEASPLTSTAINISKLTLDNASGLTPVTDKKVVEVDLDGVIKDEILDQEPEQLVGDEVEDSIHALEINRNVAGGKYTASDLDKSLYNTNESIITDIQQLVSGKLLTKKTGGDLTEIIKDQDTIESPYEDGVSLKDMLTYTNEELYVSDNSINVKPTPTSFDKTANRSRLKVLNEAYVKKTNKKDILSTIYSMQKTGVIIKEHSIVEKKSILGETEEHKLTLLTLTGGRSTIKIVIPIVRDDNTIRLSGNTYVVRKQRADIPIKKISNTIASLNSYYGKLFISKSTYKKDDLGFWFAKKLLNMYSNADGISDVVSVSVVDHTVIVPQHYGLIGRYTKSFTYKDIKFNFEYKSREKMFDITDINKLEKDGVIVGMKGKHPVLMGVDNKLVVLDSAKTKLGDIFTLLGIDASSGPIEYCSAKIYKKQVPLALLLGYYIGFTNLLKLLKVTYVKVMAGKRISISTNQYKIVFKDVVYVIDRDYGKSDLIVGGFVSMLKHTKKISYRILDDKGTFPALFTSMEFPILYINEIKLMEQMFIDPITKQLLTLFKLPTSFTGMLTKAADMLRDDNYRHPNNINGAVIKGYERISGMLYLELVRSLRTNINKSHFSKGKVEFNPYSLLNKINEDSTTVLVDDLNPIASIKQLEDVTYLGSHGRKKETMSEKTRVMHPSEIGIISESVKDNGEVAISTYLTSDPKILSTRGVVGEMTSSDGWASRISTAGMLAPFGTHDDSKRLNFATIQAAHVIPMINMELPYVMTGYEAVLATNAPNKFVISASGDGKVTDTSGDIITVKYVDGDVIKYKISPWTTKEEAGTTYTHRYLLNVKKGDVVTKDDCLAYNNAFFQQSIYDKTRVLYKTGISLTVALLETEEVYEDSAAVSARVFSLMSTVVTKVKSILLSNSDEVLDPLGVGDKVSSGSPILSIADKALSAVSGLDSRAIEVLKGLKMLTPKSSYDGTISKIIILYNCDIESLSKSISRLVAISDKNLVKSTGYTGRVDSSYSIKGIPLPVDGIEIKYYIDVLEDMGTGDKGVLSNQLKFTVGEVYREPIVSEDGEIIDVKFGGTSEENRIVNSSMLIGTTAKVLEVGTSRALDIYFDNTN